MINLGTVMFAEADQHHLVQSRFNVADEARVRLHATDDQHMIGLRGVLVEVNWNPLRRVIDDDRLHRRPDLAAHCLGSDAVSRENPQLTFGRSATVASHRGDDERVRTEALHVIDHSERDLSDVGDPATPRRDRDRLPGANGLPQLQRRELSVDFCGDIGHTTGIKLLTNTNHAREGHGLPINERLERAGSGGTTYISDSHPVPPPEPSGPTAVCVKPLRRNEETAIGWLG